MTATTTKRPGKITDGKIVAFPVQASTSILQGTMVTIGLPGQATDVKGHAKGAAAGDVATHVVVGSATESVDNSSGAAGELDVKVRVDPHVINLVGSGLTVDDDSGADAYLIDNQTIQTTATASGWHIGKIGRVLSATAAHVVFKGYNGSTLAQAAQVLRIGAQTAASSAVTNTTTETDFDETLSIPANFLKVGDKLTITGSGIATATNSTDTLTVKALANTTALATSAAVDVADNDTWAFTITGTVRSIGASGSVIFSANGQGPDAGTVSETFGGQVSATLDTTAAITIKSSATWSVASASNSCRSDTLTCEITRQGAN